MRKRLFQIVSILTACFMLMSGCQSTKIVKHTVQVSGGDLESAAASSGVSALSSAASNAVVTTSGKPIAVSGAGRDSTAKYNTTGTVTVAVDSMRPVDYQALFEQFLRVYPNIKLKVQYFKYTPNGSWSDNAMKYLATCAATNTMPDVVFDDSGFIPYYISQGWMYPLDQFIQNDPDIKYVPSNLLNDYRYGGKLYAVPEALHFNGIYINTDAEKTLNLPTPSLNWNFSQFVTFLKKGTTSVYSGAENVDQYGGWSGQMASGRAMSCYGYNITTRKFNMAALQQAINLEAQLRKYPGLEAQSLRGSDWGSTTSPYAQKFGTANLGDNTMAQDEGKTLSQLGVGTWYRINQWYLGNTDQAVKYNRKMWPDPQSTPGRLGMHVDVSFMTTSAKNPQAAFQLLRYITYSVEGNLTRLSMYDKANAGKYKLNSPYYIPATQAPAVIAKFKSLPNVGAFEKYCVDNENNCYRTDPEKLVPGWTDMLQNIIWPNGGKMVSGSLDVNSGIADLQNKCNSYINGQWSKFNTQLATVQKNFAQKQAGK